LFYSPAAPLPALFRLVPNQFSTRKLLSAFAASHLFYALKEIDTDTDEMFNFRERLKVG